jgi:hypothetical protein
MNIVYYLGAGASANAIPTINGIRTRLKDLIVFLSKYLKENLNETGFNELNFNLKNNQTILIKIIDELDWLYVQTQFHQTVDTFAKKLFLQESNELKKLKRSLITYFYFEQSLKFEWTDFKINDFNGYENTLDLRYDSLFANIITRKNNSLEVEEKLNIVTWNYDLQIEMALKNYFNLPINELKKNLRIHPNRISYDLTSGDIRVQDKFQVFKLNGNAFLDSGLSLGYQSTVYDKIKTELNAEEIISLYIDEIKTEFSDDLNLTNSAAFKYFNFAWETNENFGTNYNGRSNVIESAKKILGDADILIVIGYSFPTFNFEIDKKILSNCQLKELIIQDTNPDNIKERMKPLLKQLNPPNHNNNPQLKYSPIEISQYFPIYKY